MTLSHSPILRLALLASIAIANTAANAQESVCYTRQELTTKALGIVAKVYVPSGKTVKKGDLLIELDNRQLKAAQQEGQAAIDTAKAAIENTKATLEAAKANVALAQDAVSRLEKLKTGDTVTEQQITEARIRLTQAQSQQRMAEAGIRQAEAGLKTAEGARERLRVQLEDTYVRAEMAGTVQGLPTILGLAVQPGQSLGRIEAPAGSCAAAGK